MNYNPFLPDNMQGINEPDLTDPREQLYEEYAVVHESFEDFCDRMADEHGIMWVPKLVNRNSVIKSL